jgi:hypothetical protein
MRLQFICQGISQPLFGFACGKRNTTAVRYVTAYRSGFGAGSIHLLREMTFLKTEGRRGFPQIYAEKDADLRRSM